MTPLSKVKHDRGMFVCWLQTNADDRLGARTSICTMRHMVLFLSIINQKLCW
jgi:hypothetical protein